MEELRTLYRAIQEEAPAPDVADQQHDEPPVAALGWRIPAGNSRQFRRIKGERIAMNKLLVSAIVGTMVSFTGACFSATKEDPGPMLTEEPRRVLEVDAD